MLNNLLKSKNKPHAIIFNVSQLTDIDSIINEYAISIVCDGLNSEDTKKYTEKILNNQYFDIIKINGFDEGIKKEDILNIQNNFSLTGFEEINKKIYVIYGIEYITTQAANSLLKFLEEPPINTYAVFVTKSPNAILETIKSRCQFFNLKPSLKKYEEIANLYKINGEIEQAVAQTYFSINKLVEDLQSKKFNEDVEIVKSLISASKEKITSKEDLENFKELNYPKID
ncbi:MAG: hypothetical protein K2M43_00200 [Mycoplasmoidaceae bacterium]|nr:hypothetical protein [Mycoplasmoidaceae bacterium]